MLGPGIKLGVGDGLQLGSLNNQGMSSNSSSNGNNLVLLVGQPSSSSSFSSTQCKFMLISSIAIAI